MYSLFHVKNCFNKDQIISESNEGCLLVRGGEIFSLYIKTNNVFVLSKYSLIEIHKNILGMDT